MKYTFMCILYKYQIPIHLSIYIIYVLVCVNNGVLRNTVYTRYRYILLLLLLLDQQKGTQSLVPRCSYAYNYTWPVYPNIVGRLIYATSSSVYIYYIAAAGIVRGVVRFYFFPIRGEKNPSVHSKRKRFVCKCTHTHTNAFLHIICMYKIRTVYIATRMKKKKSPYCLLIRTIL